MILSENQIQRIRNDFYYFVYVIFSQSKSLFQKDFVSGKYLKELCELLQYNKKTARIAPRDHFKSTAFYAHFIWKMLKDADTDIEGHYFSFQYNMAAYHINKIKKAVNSNPILSQLLIDKKPTAESVIDYTIDGKHHYTLEPHGMLEFKRGIHAPLLYVDDPFQDPASKMIITVIKKINDIFTGQILDMAMDELHVCGTPQTQEDFFFNKDIMSRFKTMIKPAIINEKNKEVLWEEWMGWEELMVRKKEKGEKLFNQEYLCSPVFAEEAFINKDQLYSCVNNDLSNLVELETENDVIAGFDIGKKSHPSHLAVFEITGGKRRQIYNKFMDRWDYTRQIEFLKNIITDLRVDKLYYDATRGEFESLKEQGELPVEMEGVVFTSKTKHSMAMLLDKAICSKEIEFINDQRMLEQMLLVTNDLQAIETPQGHADSFWSIALTFRHEETPQPDIKIL